MISAYPCQLTVDEEDGGLVATFPDVPEAITGGRVSVPRRWPWRRMLSPRALAGYVHEKWAIPAGVERADGRSGVGARADRRSAAKLALLTRR